MRAVVCTRLGQPRDLVIEERPGPEPGPGEVRVAVAAAGVQFVDVLMVAGAYQHKPTPPFVPGLEAAGIVQATGEGVTAFKPGDRVMTRHLPGAFAEAVVVPEAAAFPVPDVMDLQSAAGFRSAYGTAYHALVDAGRLQAGETVLIHGAAGGIGIPAVQLAKLLGATVIATAGSDEKLAAARECGADHAVNYRAGGFRDAIKALTGGKGVDIVYDPVGGDVFDESMRCLNYGARLLILGFTGGRPALARTNHLLIKSAQAIGVRAGEFSRRFPQRAAANTRTLVDLVAQGKLTPRVSHTFPMERVADAMQVIIDRKSIGKVLLTMGM